MPGVAAMLVLVLSPAFVYAAPTAATTTTFGITAAGAAVTTVAAGTPVKLTATVVSGTTAVHPGTVNFCDAAALHCVNAAFLGTAQLTTVGTASLNVRLPGGVHSIAAVFVGTKSYGGSKSTAAQVAVTGLHPTANSLSFSGVQGNYSLSSTVTSSQGTGVAPTGTVSFLDATNGNATLGSASLVAGVPTNSDAVVAGISHNEVVLWVYGQARCVGAEIKRYRLRYLAGAQVLEATLQQAASQQSNIADAIGRRAVVARRRPWDIGTLARVENTDGG